MRKHRQRRPSVEYLESRLQLSATPTTTGFSPTTAQLDQPATTQPTQLLDYPWNYAGTIPAGSYRIAPTWDVPPSAQATPSASTTFQPADTTHHKHYRHRHARSDEHDHAKHRGATPNVVVSGMTLGFASGSPLVGTNFSAALTINPIAPQTIANINWTMSIVVANGGNTYTTPPLFLGTGTGTVMPSISASVPGTYTVTAVITYQSTNPSASPGPPTTVSASASFAAPDGVIKGGAMLNTPVPLGQSVQAVDTVTAGGTPVGSLLTGMAQESINGQPWYPPAPSASFSLASGHIVDQMGWGAGDPNWNTTPISATVPAFTYNQALQISWTLTGTNQNGVFDNYAVTDSLGNLTWSWYKLSATTWMAS